MKKSLFLSKSSSNTRLDATNGGVLSYAFRNINNGIKLVSCPEYIKYLFVCLD